MEVEESLEGINGNSGGVSYQKNNLKNKAKKSFLVRDGETLG